MSKETSPAPQLPQGSEEKKPKFSLASIKLDIEKLTLEQKLRLFGAFVSKARSRTGKSIHQIARELDIDYTTLQYWEKSDRIPEEKNIPSLPITKIAEVYNADEVDLERVLRISSKARGEERGFRKPSVGIDKKKIVE